MKVQVALSADQQEWFTDAADEIDAEIRSYSGRHMNGETCLGIVVGSVTELAVLVLLVNEADPYLAEGLAHNACSDSMGIDCIVYWPYIAAISPSGDE
jgi:hypothetical protein